MFRYFSRPRGAKKAARTPRRPPEPPPRSTERGVIALDSNAIRKKALLGCQKAHTAFLKAQEQLNHWEQKECPAAQAWAAGLTGEVNSRIHELSRKLEQEQELYFMMSEMEEVTGASPADCHDQVIREMETPPTEEEREEWEEEERRQAEAEDLFGDEDDDEDPVQDFFDQLFGPGAGGDARSRSQRRKKGAADETPRHQDIRTLYRQLCRDLHPDGGGEFDDRRRDLFHQVQEAYEARDLARLEHLASVVENGGDVPVKASRVEIILRALKRFQESTQYVRRMLKEAKRSPGWGFLTWTESQREREAAALLAQRKKQLRHLEANLASISQVLDRYRQASARRQAKRGAASASTAARRDKRRR